MSANPNLAALVDLIFPRACPCGKWDTDLCPECCAALAAGWRRVDTQAPYLAQVTADGELCFPYPTYALTDYVDPAVRVIVTWKNQVNAGLAAAITELWQAELGALPLRQWGSAGEGSSGASPILWVPAPSAANRKRSGRFVAGMLAKQAAETLEGEYADVLARHSPRLPGWAGRKPVQLIGRGKKSYQIYATANLTGRRVVAVDDVVTTGATIAGISRAVNQAGGQLIGAIVLAAAADPRQRHGGKC